ncbi:(R,R)-butanediol dehydrogenase/meso-butanediol dehydrogenase/diacetyl reductase [Actinoplanes tereljensis]|uniref:Threonine dehydrogenase n=1 Tax=Paractinoplanes tereljensis TaxID=571912 RepID=A0A919NVL2_9ACTN|nr:zinc-binding dehydrogenase [Actinoplanes tereljensis]GIF25538.1 threonine dehydrogenase [Actinoplanes tereljensis]
MLAAVWHGAKDVRVEEVAAPGAPRPGEVVVAVDLACICASDLAEYRDGPHVIPVRRPHRLTGRTAPVILGHEFVGRVLEAGDSGLTAGDRVCGDACLRCGVCFWCRRGEYNICESGGSIGLHTDGAFARYLTVPGYTLHRVPDAVDDRAAAIVEPLAVGLHGLRRGRFEAGETVTVVGFGMVGAAVTLLAAAIGAGRVIVVEAAPDRAEAARQAGATDVLAPGDTLRGAVRELTEGRGSDLVLDCTGRADVLPVSVELSRRGGRVVVCGLAHEPSAIRADRLVYFEREVIGSLGYRYDHEAVLRLLASGRLDVSRLFAPAIRLEDIVTDGFEATNTSKLRIPVAIGEA